MPVTVEKPAPYGPPGTVLEVINRFRDRGLPTPINKEVLARAGIPESIIPRVLQTLQALDLIDDAGQPTPTLEGIRRAPQAELNQRKIEWLNGAYADALSFVDPATADEVQVRDAFRNYNPVGQQARMVTLFMGLYADAGVGAERAPAAPRQRSPITTPRVIRTGGEVRAMGKTATGLKFFSTKRSLVTENTGTPAALAGLLASLPQQGKGWTQEQRDKFYTTFGTVLDFCFPIVTKVTTEEDVEDLA